MRLIDADELLTAFPIDDEPSVTKSCIRMTIQHMPTIEPKQSERIPCSERLPEPYEIDENGYMKAYLVQRYSWMYTAVWNGRKWILWTIGTELKGVTAWMPLPESYKEGTNDEVR